MALSWSTLFLLASHTPALSAKCTILTTTRLSLREGLLPTYDIQILVCFHSQNHTIIADALQQVCDTYCRECAGTSGSFGILSHTVLAILVQDNTLKVTQASDVTHKDGADGYRRLNQCIQELSK